MTIIRHDIFMAQALILARQAAAKGEVPVGALVIDGQGDVVGQGANATESGHTALAHAEMIALKRASEKLGRWRLQDCTLYVTLEPCPMCAGAMVQSQLGTLVFGAPDNKAGAAGSLFNITHSPLLNHRITVIGGILEQPCAQLLQDFFKCRRN